MNITIIGAGYVGLVSAACLAEVGNTVVCVEHDTAKVDSLRRGRIPIFEPGLDAMVADNTACERLRFTTALGDHVAPAEVLFIAVGTPPRADGGAEVEHVLAAARAIGQHLDPVRWQGVAPVIATKSTVPLGTTERVREVIAAELAERGVACPFHVVSNPEFLKQGAAVEDFMRPDRIVVGAAAAAAMEVMRTLYAPFNRNHERVMVMDIPSAELTKYAANAMLATRISLMNELAAVAENAGADIEAVRTAIGADPRIGYAYLYPGCGYGGSCLSKDIRALMDSAAAAGGRAPLLAAVEAVNHAAMRRPVEKLLAHFGGSVRGMTIALWGLAFKPDTDDMRDAPSRVVLEALWAAGATVQAYDPAATDTAARLYGDRADLRLYADDPYAALNGAAALVIVTEWRVLRAAAAERIRAALAGDVVVDGRNLYDPVTLRAAGLTYYGSGRSAG